MKNQNTQESLIQEETSSQNENNRQVKNEVFKKPKNKNDSVQLPDRYRQYMFTKRNLRGEPRPEVFPVGEANERADVWESSLSRKIQTEEWRGDSRHTDSEVSQDGEDGHIHQIKQVNSPKHSQQRVYDPTGIAPTLCAGNLGGGKSPSKIIQANNPTHSNDRVYRADGISPTLNTMQGGMRQPKVVVPVLTPGRSEKRQNGRRFKEDGDPSFTLTSQDKHGVYDGTKIRRLTPTECERLQGFPDGWTEGVSDTQRYKVLGNAISVPVVEFIVKHLPL